MGAVTRITGDCDLNHIGPAAPEGSEASLETSVFTTRNFCHN